ncbi:MAG: gamma-butyrobetaine hydroxylase-like domain-containing protein [Panacagrimonas sp.]
MNAPPPKSIALHKRQRTLDLTYADGQQFSLPAEYLRVHSPSAEVQGHGTPVLVGGKRQVGIKAVQPVGRYAVRLVFDDGHDTGLYSWDVLWELATRHQAYWDDYLQRLQATGMSRDSELVKLAALPRKYKPATP